MVPWPPNNFTISRICGFPALAPGARHYAQHDRSCWPDGPGIPFSKERKTIIFPSGEMCGNQSSSSSLVMRSAFASFGPAPSAGMRQTSQVPEGGSS